MTNISEIFDIANPGERFLNVIAGPYQNDTGVPVDEYRALGLTAVSRAVRSIANPIASVSKHIIQKLDDKRVKLVAHPTSRLLNRKVNSYTTSNIFFGLGTGTALLWGNFLARIIRDQDYNPVELRPLKVQDWRPRLVDHELFYVNRSTGEVLPANDVFHIKDFGTDGIWGMSRIAQHRQAVGIGLVSEKFQASFFGKGAHQGGIVTLPDDYDMGDTPEEEEGTINRLRKQIIDPYTGAENAHKVMMLDAGMKFEKLTMPLKDAEFLMSRKFQVVEIARMFDTPPHKLYDLERSTHNNIEHQAIEFVMDALLPWSRAWESEINDKLLRETEKDQGVYTKFNLDSLIRGDIKTRYEAHALAVGSKGPGWVSPSEIRSIEDMDLIDDDKLFKPMNFNRQSEGLTNDQV